MPPGSEAGPPSGAGVRLLGGFLLQEPLRNSVRVLILISLGINGHLGFTELLGLTATSKGSLSHHLDQLASAGLARSRMVFTLAGPRVRVELTPEGRRVYGELSRALAELPPGGSEGAQPQGPAAELSHG